MSRKTISRETEKPKKLTRAQKKEIDAVLRKYKGDGKPRTAQATIPYEAIYPDGVCRIDRRTFSKCIAFEDISYQLAQPETRTAIFEHLCDLYNYVDASIHAEYQTLSSEKNGFYTRYKKAQIELRELRTAQQNVDAFFRKEERSHAVPQQEVK